MSVILITDSAADYEQHELKDRGVLCVPLSITFGEETFQDGTELSKDEFYARLLKREQFPFTSQPAPADFLTHFEGAREAGDSVVAILLSGALSGTVQSAQIAKEMAKYDEIHIVDSLSAVTGLRILVDTAVRMREEGRSAQDIAEAIEALKRRVQITAAVDTLEYLHRGGRLTKTQARIGGLVSLKPILTLDEAGKIHVMEKALGLKKAFAAVLKEFAKAPYDPAYPVYIPYAHVKENALRLAELAQRDFPGLVDAGSLYNIGPTIGTHTGDNVFGFIYIRRD